ncbi:hypothetical protein GN958_ATG17824 [Phytophthora infestans]|uniref:DDE Tnp4 domain-containing protein n=1 Tax=Phytophthora infestans TaxID=4787 RepID=A0A8S9U4B8_PHYIN|nr:hypothetical protein GN958_ATG17824 [Phytophthora infestans]
MRWDVDSCSEADSDDASISSDDASDTELELEVFPVTAGAVESEDEEMQIELMDEGIGNYNFGYGLAALLTYYGNGCGDDGDGIGGAATQLGMLRRPALRYIQSIEKLLYDMLDDVVYCPAPTATDEWDAVVEGFAKRGGDFPDVACIFDGTLGFYDKSAKPSYNCLAAIDHRNKFQYIGVFSGSNSDQSMWNQSEILGARARHLCPPGIK